MNGKKKSTDKTNFVKDFLKLEIKIIGALASLKIVPRNEALNRALKSNFEVLNEQSIATWENYLRNISVYENTLQKIATTENDFDAEYLHNNLNKLLTNASDIRVLYNDTIGYIKRGRNEPEFEHAYIVTRDLVNNLLVAVRRLVELDETFIGIVERNNIDYVEKYKLYDVD